MIKETIKGIELVFHTSEDVFSPQRVDSGTLAMLSSVDFTEDDKVLDLGCGYGIVGILAAKLIGSDKVVMVDNNHEAVSLAKINAGINGVGGIKILQSDGFDNIDDTGFSKILSNPPYHTNFKVAKRFIEKGFNRLKINGSMYMVTKRKKWYKNKLISVFGGVKILEIDGYYVFMSIKKSGKYAYAAVKGIGSKKRG